MAHSYPVAVGREWFGRIGRVKGRTSRSDFNMAFWTWIAVVGVVTYPVGNLVGPQNLTLYYALLGAAYTPAVGMLYSFGRRAHDMLVPAWQGMLSMVMFIPGLVLYFSLLFLSPLWLILALLPMPETRSIVHKDLFGRKVVDTYKNPLKDTERDPKGCFTLMAMVRMKMIMPLVACVINRGTAEGEANPYGPPDLPADRRMVKRDG